MSTKKNNTTVKVQPIVSNEPESKINEVSVNTTKVAEKALKEATEASKLVIKTRTKENPLRHVASTKAQKTATLTAEEKYIARRKRYSINRDKLQAKKDRFVARIIEENKLDASFTKEIAESMWCNKHDTKNRAIGGYTTKVYDIKDKVWKKVDGEKWSLVAIKAKETLAELRKERTVTETVVDSNGKQYTRKRILKPVFKKNTKVWSLDEAKKRFKEQDAARKVRFENLPKKEVITTTLKAKMIVEQKEEAKDFKLIVRRQSSEDPEKYYDFATIPFKGTLKAAEVRAEDLFVKYEVDTSFIAVVIKENDDIKKVLNRKNQTLSNAA